MVISEMGLGREGAEKQMHKRSLKSLKNFKNLLETGKDNLLIKVRMKKNENREAEGLRVRVHTKDLSC